MSRFVIITILICLLSACGQAPVATGNMSETDADYAAHWIHEDLILISPHKDTEEFLLFSSASGRLDEGEEPDNIFPLMTSDLPSTIASEVPHLASFNALIPVNPITEVKLRLKEQLAVIQKNAAGDTIKISWLQTARLLDAIYTSGDNDADEVMDYGAIVAANKTQFALWAPTAIAVNTQLYDAEKQLIATVAMVEDDNGVWRSDSAYGQGTFYRFQLDLFHPQTQQIEVLEVTDPYSLSLSRNSEFSQVVDLANEQSKPQNWDTQKDTVLSHPESLILYETHIRDFSASDKNLSDSRYKGKYKAFSETTSDGARHLTRLKNAGLNTIHLLPAYDLSTVNEDPTKVIYPDDPLSKMCGLLPDLDVCLSETDKSMSLKQLLQNFDASSSEAQSVIEQIRAFDPYNWGYDPFHYTVPEGSYALDPEGIPRIIEFREMVKSLHNQGFRVIMDVVYNHTYAAGLAEKSVLDKIVPNYYHRLNPISGKIEQSTCCENTATEHRMMAKLMVDSLVVWSEHYKIDGFRFDLMGHQPKALMLEAREAVRNVDPDTYFYGEGWNFGEVANNAQFEQAAQIPLAGTEIGTFTDRLRDAVRGGSSFVSGDKLRGGQGIANGLKVLPNELQASESEQGGADEYALSMDQIRVGLAGNLAEFPLINADGKPVMGKDILYGDAPTGYALDPADTINYVSKHDNQTLWDNNQYRFAFEATTEQRVRMHNLSLAYPLMSQGIPFLHMGGELLRSKSFLRDSYDYGDWFNAVDFSMQTNNYHVGLPPAVKDETNWEIISKILERNEGRDRVRPEDIAFAASVFIDFIAIRSSSPLFSLQTADDIIKRVKFHNTGEQQEQGLIVMSIEDGKGSDDLDPAFDAIVVLFNNDIKAKTFAFPEVETFSLHPVQQNSVDKHVRQASASNQKFNVPALTVAVFVK